MGGSQFKILLAVFALGLIGAAAVLVSYMWEKRYKPEILAVKEVAAEKEAENRPPPPDAGKKQFANAIAALKAGDSDQAKEHLSFILQFYQDSEAHQDSKRILGQMNIDELFSPAPGPGKIEHTIKSGDALVKIARDYQCTIDYIMRTNGSTGSIIHIGDKLWVAPLLFSLEVNLTNKTLTVFRLTSAAPDDPAAAGAEETKLEEVFFKEYQILDVNLPPTVTAPLTTSITSKPAWNGPKRAVFTSSSYHTSHRWLQTGRMGVLIQEMPADLENAPEERKFGILLSGADARELYNYIRVDAELRVVN